MMSLNSFERIQSVQSLQSKRIQQSYYNSDYNSREEQEDNNKRASSAPRVSLDHGPVVLVFH